MAVFKARVSCWPPALPFNSCKRKQMASSSATTRDRKFEGSVSARKSLYRRAQYRRFGSGIFSALVIRPAVRPRPAREKQRTEGGLDGPVFRDISDAVTRAVAYLIGATSGTIP